MAGILKGDTVVLDQKEGSQLYNRGNYGYPVKRTFELDLIEAAYLVECKRLTVLDSGKEMTFEDIFGYASSNLDEFDIKYIVYRDIRQRGCIVKNESGLFDMSVYERGKTIMHSPPQFYLRAVSERSASDIASFNSDIMEAERKGKDLMYGVVDEEGDLTYYVMNKRSPDGRIDSAVLGEISGTLVRDRVFVFDGSSAECLKPGFYGKMIADSLQLSLIEACYLMDRGCLKVVDTAGSDVTSDRLKEFGRTVQDEFDLRLKAYSDLRRRGLIVKTGFKYGTHFRLYEDSPDKSHARYLVHVVSGDNTTMWPEIARAVRLSGGVKKEFLFCRVTDGGTEYMEFRWFRP